MSLGKHSYDKEPVLHESVLGAGLRVGGLIGRLFVLILLSTFPFKFWHLADVRPAFLLIAVYYWAVFTPYRLPPVWAFAAGIVLDLLYAGPLGLNALTLVGVQWSIRAQRKFLLGQSFLVLWLCFFLVAAAVFLLHWCVFSLFSLHLAPVRPVAISAMLTAFLFPVMAGIFHTFGKAETGRGG